jgi:hypothetical protein
MKKPIAIIAFLIISFLGFGQNVRPYVIRYQNQGDTIQHNTQSVSGIHIDNQGQELNYDNGTEWTSWADMDTVYIYRGDEIVNPAYVPIDWDNASLLSASDSIGDYQIQFNGGLPELQPGSIIAIDQDTVVRYIFIETVNVNGNTVSVTSTEAYLTDIFADTEFTLTTVTNGKASPQGKVFYPVAAYQRDEQGGYKAMDLKRMRDNRWSFTHNLWHFGENYDGEELFGGDNYSVYMEYMNFDFDIDLELYINFGGRTVHEIVGEALDRYRSRTLMVRPALLGTFNTQQRVRCDIEGSCSYSPGYDIWKHNLFRPIDVKFVVYGVPIVITLNSDLYREVQVTASGEISAYTGFTDHAEGRIGFEWHQTGGMTPETTFSNTFEFTPPTVEGQGTITAKVWAFPRVRLVLWHTFGPSFDFKPYLSVTLSGGFREEMLGQGNDYCAWSLDCNTGLDAACGLSIFNEIVNYSTPNWNIINKPLYHSPQRIEHNAAKSSGMKLGQRNEVSFTVYDRNHLSNTDVVTPLPQFVKFEGDGDISSEYGIASGGTVSVDWTPLSDSDVLYARLYDIDGNVISEAEVEQDTIGDWVDLGLPSGLLWATRNVGASSPEDYGDYFAWGETSPKSMFNWDTYIYGYYDGSNVHLTKYNTESYWGPVDNLTILQPGDDAATANWGNGARMPTKEEWQELRDHCTSTWTTQNGVNGRLFTGPNGNSLFLPAAGYRWDDELGSAGYDGDYWSSSLYTDYPYYAWSFYFYPGNYHMNSGDRYYGYSVRPVRSARQN